MIWTARSLSPLLKDDKRRAEGGGRTVTKQIAADDDNINDANEDSKGAGQRCLSGGRDVGALQ
jgi:hypothetical protein